MRLLWWWFQAGVGFILGQRIAERGIEASRDQRTHSAVRGCCGCVVLIVGVLVIAALGWGLWDWIASSRGPETY